MRFAVTDLHQSRGIEFDAATPHELRLALSDRLFTVPWAPGTSTLKIWHETGGWLFVPLEQNVGWLTGIWIRPHLLPRDLAERLFRNARWRLESYAWFEQMLRGLAGFSAT